MGLTLSLGNMGFGSGYLTCVIVAVFRVPNWKSSQFDRRPRLLWRSIQSFRYRLISSIPCKWQCCCQDFFLGLETKTETWTKWIRVHSSIDTMVSRSKHWLHQFLILVTEHSLKGSCATNYGNRATGVGTKHAASRPRPISGLETRDQDRDLGLQVSRPRPGQNELECTRVSRSQHWQMGYGDTNVMSNPPPTAHNVSPAQDREKINTATSTRDCETGSRTWCRFQHLRTGCVARRPSG